MNYTEESSPYDNASEMSVKELLTAINKEDAKVHEAVRQAIPQIEELIEAILPGMRSGGRLFYIGAGTSGRLGVLDASEMPPTYGVSPQTITGLIAGGDGAIRKAVEGAEDDTELAWKDLIYNGIKQGDAVIGIAASGTTPYVIGGLERARAEGIVTGSVTCNPGSPVTKAAEHPIVVITGPEFITGSTRMKAGTAQKMVLNMISTSLMVQLGRVEGNRMVNMQLTNKKLVARGARMITAQTGRAEEESRELLLRHGSVKNVLDYLKNEAQ
ncbi:MAG: N-acetylmuramic acid 6-phosphate etherase [Rikenellaceae bacterium]|nr:N-acetylmuramic acid 6-phosphate etherase [Rikenellaceae bacterium]